MNLDKPEKFSWPSKTPFALSPSATLRRALSKGERGFGSHPMGEMCREPFMLRQAQHERSTAHLN